jgi:uncharacterized protein with HEPN domain
MPKDEMLDSLDLIAESLDLVQERFSRIRVAEDFVNTSEGVTLLDAISMRLQVIGESVKQIQKSDVSFLQRYPVIEWDKIARFRDLVSHHYQHVDHEIVYDICNTHIPKLREVVQKMRIALSAIRSGEEDRGSLC